MSGIKHDNGKPEPRLVLSTMARAILAVSEVASYGAKKYSADNWLLVDDAEQRYTDAGDRHRLQSAYQDNDEESGMSHLAHAAWNALAVLDIKLREAEKREAQDQVVSLGNRSTWTTGDELAYIGEDCEYFSNGNFYRIDRIAETEIISSGVVTQSVGDIFVRSHKQDRSIRFSAEDVLQYFYEFAARDF